MRIDVVKQMNSETVKLIFARANEFKEGDLLVGGTGDDVIRKLSLIHI